MAYSKKLINNRFTVLRNWLYPGLIWDSAPPDVVDGALRCIVDVEHFVPVPRFFMEAISPAAGVTRAATVSLENFVRNPRIVSPGGIATAKPTQFLITDIYIKQSWPAGATQLTAHVSTRGQTDYAGATFADPANLSVGPTRVHIPTGDSNFAGVYVGDLFGPGAGLPLGPGPDFWGLNGAWVRFPDLAPGQTLLVQDQDLNLPMHISMMWTERRPPAQPNIFPV